MKKTVYLREILDEVERAPKKADKILVLQKYQTEKGFKEVLFLTYDPTLVWGIVRSDIENLRFQHMDIADYDLAPENVLMNARRRLFQLTNFRGIMLPKEKIIKLVTQFFSSWHPDDIEIFKQMVDRKLEVKGLNEALVREAFPGWLYDKPEKSDKPES